MKKPKRCPDCGGKLYLIGALWCCDHCPFGWVWHRSERKGKGKEAA